MPRPGPRYRAARALVVALVAGVALSSCSSNFGARDSATDQGDEILGLWRPMVIIALCILGLVVALVAWCVVRYRARGRSDDPNQRQYVIPIEVLYTAIPVLIVVATFVLSFRAQDEVDALGTPDVTIDVLGFQWQWQFQYRESDITVTGLPGEPAVMVLPVRKTIRLHLRSRDVIHSFYVPRFLYKRDVIPGVDNEFDVDVVDEGIYRAYCAEFCGLDHARMTFTVKAVSPAEFREWVEEHEGERVRGVP